MDALVLEINTNRQKTKYFYAMKTFYKIIQIVWGLDFGFFEYNSLNERILWNTITILQSVFISCVCLLNLHFHDVFSIAVWYNVTVIHYIFNVICLVLFNPNRKFYKLFFELDSIDLKLSLHSKTLNFEMKIMLVIFLHFSFRISMGCLYCYWYESCLKPVGIGVLFLSLVSSLYFIQISYGFVFYLINCRLKKLASILITDRLDFASLQQTYKLITDLAEAYKTAFDSVFVVALLSNVSEVISFIYYSVTLMRSEIYVGSFGLRYFRLEYVIVAEGLMLTFAPAICAGMLSSQAEKIKIILHNKLMEDLDVISINEIKRFICYVEARGCRFRVWKVIPLDVDLLGMVLSFCVTYLIVIIQFTNK